MGMLVPFASILNFPLPESGGHTDIGRASYTSREEKTRTTIPPAGSFITCTTNHPAPSSFLPWHYGRQYIQTGGYVVWLACTASGETHVRTMLRKSVSSVHSGKKVSGRDCLICIDAAEILLGAEQSTGKAGSDARPALWRLQHTVEQTLMRVRAIGGWGPNEHSGTEIPVIVILDDASMLAWLVEQISDNPIVDDEPSKGVTSKADEQSEDPRIQLLRTKRRQGNFAIHQDAIGEKLGSFLCEKLFVDVCEPNGASLLVHLATNNTSILAPASRTPASRGGSYGVGTGFDADDAGEENEEDELYEEHTEQWFGGDGQSQGQTSQQEQEFGAKSAQAGLEGRRVAAAGIDWRVDSLLRRILLCTDVWIETRGLRSGKARDCHGEICCHALLRPCLARNMPLPELPLPGDALLTLRAGDRSAKPLKLFSQLSLTSATGMSGRKDGSKETDQQIGQPTNLNAFKIESMCQGRKAAMLYRVGPSGEAVAWSRGGGNQL